MQLNKIITLENGKRIAEFDNGYYTAYYNFLTDSYDWTNLFRLDAENLQIRIENLKKDGLDYSIEQSALYQINNP